jgi:hypothetical protein
VKNAAAFSYGTVSTKKIVTPHPLPILEIFYPEKILLPSSTVSLKKIIITVKLGIYI